MHVVRAGRGACQREKTTPHPPPHIRKANEPEVWGFRSKILERSPFIRMPAESLGTIPNSGSLSLKGGTFAGSGRNVGGAVRKARE